MILLPEMDLIPYNKTLVQASLSVSLLKSTHSILNALAVRVLIALEYILAMAIVNIEIWIEMLLTATLAMISTGESSYTTSGVYYQRLFLHVCPNEQVNIKILQITAISIKRSCLQMHM
jgi:hypothetical protein